MSQVTHLKKSCLTHTHTHTHTHPNTRRNVQQSDNLRRISAMNTKLRQELDHKNICIEQRSAGTVFNSLRFVLEICYEFEIVKKFDLENSSVEQSRAIFFGRFRLFFSDYVRKYTHEHVHSCIHDYTHTCIHTCKHANMHGYILTYKHTNKQIYIHTNIQTYMHTCIHAYIARGRICLICTA